MFLRISQVYVIVTVKEKKRT